MKITNKVYLQSCKLISRDLSVQILAEPHTTEILLSQIIPRRKLTPTRITSLNYIVISTSLLTLAASHARLLVVTKQYCRPPYCSHCTGKSRQIIIHSLIINTRCISKPIIEKSFHFIQPEFFYFSIQKIDYVTDKSNFFLIHRDYFKGLRHFVLVIFATFFTK